MKVLITGAKGMLGTELSLSLEQNTHHQILALGRDKLDITNGKLVKEIVATQKPDVIINCAAYTAVDKAEEEKEKCYSINADGPYYLALNCAETNSYLIHISTDFVFDGQRDSPYTEEDKPNPLSVYGSSKWKGEEGIKKVAKERGWRRWIIIPDYADNNTLLLWGFAPDPILPNTKVTF